MSPGPACTRNCAWMQCLPPQSRNSLKAPWSGSRPLWGANGPSPCGPSAATFRCARGCWYAAPMFALVPRPWPSPWGWTCTRRCPRQPSLLPQTPMPTRMPMPRSSGTACPPWGWSNGCAGRLALRCSRYQPHLPHRQHRFAFGYHPCCRGSCTCSRVVRCAPTVIWSPWPVATPFESAAPSVPHQPLGLNPFTPSSALVTVIVVSLAPFVGVMVTSFTKIIVVLSLLRNALGLQQVPPNVVLNGMALVLTIYVMLPVGLDMAERARSVSNVGSTSGMLAVADAAKEPLRDFLVRHSSAHERAFFLKTAQKTLSPERAAQISERDFVVVVPAFTFRELSAAFKIGFLIFLPFLIIDLVIANILTAMGMMMLSPTTISLPFKLLLFVLVDGWVKLTHGLVLSYGH